LANQVKFDADFLVSERLACPLFGKQWLKKHTTSWDFTSGTLTIQGYKFKLEEEEDLPNVCRKIKIIEDAVVPPQSRLTVAGLFSARPVNVLDWLTRHRMVKPWVQILHSLVDNRASTMSLLIVNDSEEDYICKKGEVITPMIPDLMGIEGWYGEEQAAQVIREGPWDFTGPIPPPNGKVKSLVSPKTKVKKEVTAPTTSGAGVKEEAESMELQLTPTKHDEYPEEVKFLEVVELSPILMNALVSDHIIDAINNCAKKDQT